MEEKLAPAVIFIIVDKTKVLLEEQTETAEYPKAEIFPGGKVEKIDRNIVDSLIREVREELGILPLWFSELPQTEITLSPLGRVLHPFVVTIWDGDIPEKVLDNGHLLSWRELDDVIDSPISSVSKLAQDLKDYLAKKQ